MNVRRLIENTKAGWREKKIQRLKAQSDDRERERMQLEELKRYEKQKLAVAKSKEEYRSLQQQNSPTRKIAESFKKGREMIKKSSSDSNSPFKPTSSDRVRDTFGKQSGGNVFSGMSEAPKKKEGKTIVIKVK